MKRAIVLAFAILGMLMCGIDTTQAQGGVVMGAGFRPVGGVVVEPSSYITEPITEIPPPPVDAVPGGEIPIDIELPPVYVLPPFSGPSNWSVSEGATLPNWDNSTGLPLSLNLPAPMSLTAPSFPGGLGLSPFPTLTVSTLPTRSLGLTPELSGTGSFTGVTSAAELMASGLISDIGISDPNSATLFGYTAMEAAAEMVDGMEIALMYARALQDIDVIGPSVIAILIGLAYIALVLFVRMLIKALILVIDVLVRLWELLPFT